MYSLRPACIEFGAVCELKERHQHAAYATRNVHLSIMIIQLSDNIGRLEEGAGRRVCNLLF